MANPQLENGKMELALEILEAKMRIKIPGEANKVLECIWYFTYGNNCKSAKVTLADIQEKTGLSKTSASRGIKYLLDRKMIIVKIDNNSQKNPKIYAFNKDYEVWNIIVKIDNPTISNKSISKDIILTNILYSRIIKNYPFVKEKTKSQKETDYEEMNKLNRLDGFSYEQIEAVIEWSQQDNFWKQNIRSVDKLRKQFETLLIRIKAQIDQKKGIGNAPRGYRIPK